MTKKILIAEDTEEFKVRYRQWAESYGFEVVEASTVEEGLVKLIEVDAVITDHGLKQGNGNDLAQIAKEKSLPVAGITSGAPDIFDKNYVDIPESKNITQERFKTILDCLFKTNPSKAYGSTQPNKEYDEILTAANILFQGYYTICALKEGVDEVEHDGKVVLSKEDMSMMRDVAKDMSHQDPREVFEMFRTGELDPLRVYEASCQNDSSLRKDQRLKSIFERISKGDENPSLSDAVYASLKTMPSYE